ncbi:MAG: hypothetical protein IPI35_06010 [Deltaproteobacteria bacterium]|nr:hypothetical protein [Deltaproteobacteria bacterium]
MHLDGGLLIMLVMSGGDSNTAKTLADENGLTFPVLTDPSYEVFNRWNPSNTTPSTTLLRPGGLVEEIETTWYPEQIEEPLYGE